MHSTQRKPPSTPLCLSIVFGILLCIFPALALASASQPEPPPEDELICHTSDPDDCYPRVFRPTDEFQTLHEDQEMPHGLHVRLNMSSGKLEAKINVDGEVPEELEGAAVDQSVLVVDPDQPEEPQIPPGAPQYEPVGKVRTPENEPEDFSQELETVAKVAQGNDGDIDTALDVLGDFAHDIYYGLKITENAEALKALFCLMTARQEGVSHSREERAAAVLAGALSNNPTALLEVTKAWPGLMGSQCPGDNTPLSKHFYSSIVTTGDPAINVVGGRGFSSTTKTKVGAINGLLKSDSIRKDFLDNDGMKMLLEVLIPGGKAWETPQRKVGQLVLDNFLDEDMGAKPGQWPRAPRLSDETCQSAESQLEEGCWDYHVERITETYGQTDPEHWSNDLHSRLAALRKGENAPPEHVEL